MSNEYQQNQQDQPQQDPFGTTDQSGNQQGQYGNQPDQSGDQQGRQSGSQQDQSGNQQDQYGNQPDQSGNQQDQYGNQPDQSGSQQDQSQQQGADTMGGVRRMAGDQVNQGIDNIANKVPGGERYSQQAKDAASGAMDNLENEAEKRGRDMFGGDQNQ
jgi:hypothetical protein